MTHTAPSYRRWLFAVAVLLVASTFAMMALGGLVTSHDAGMAVPGGFTTAGTLSLITPVNDWWHEFDTRLEHAHRLMGYAVGFAAILFLIGVMRPSAGQRGWVKALAVVVLLFVIAQGVLGAYRVNHNSFLLAGIHGVTGQIYLGLTVIAAAAVGKRWIGHAGKRGPMLMRLLTVALVGLLLLQLTLGSAVRHSHSALAIPDWPLHYGQLMPPADDAALAQAIAAYPQDKLPERFGYQSEGGTYQAWQVHLHFTHRVMGYAVFAAGLGLAGLMLVTYGGGGGGLSAVIVPTVLLAGLMFTQVMLGIATVASGEDANFATLHQTCGAALLATAVWLAVRVRLTPAGAAA